MPKSKPEVFTMLQCQLLKDLLKCYDQDLLEPSELEASMTAMGYRLQPSDAKKLANGGKVDPCVVISNKTEDFMVFDIWEI